MSSFAAVPAAADPDTFTGLAVLVDGGENVTIKNLRAHGYKIGVLARRSRQLHHQRVGSQLQLEAAALFSLVEHESLLDWMSYHRNDKDEWLQSGAGIYLADSPGAEIDHTTIVQGQNGLMLARSDNARIWNNNFSFLSGLGIALYRASSNTIMHNQVNWCVRGYSHTFYNRGQDSAGILDLRTEQQEHRRLQLGDARRRRALSSGPGSRRWTRGRAGANDNLFYDNDFSFAPTNGIEATFSRNMFYGNRVEGCWHGVWGGYSFDSWIVGEQISRATPRRSRSSTARTTRSPRTSSTVTRPPSGSGRTPRRIRTGATRKHRDTRSRDYVIAGNTFTGNTTALKIAETQNVRVLTNTFDKVADGRERSLVTLVTSASATRCRARCVATDARRDAAETAARRHGREDSRRGASRPRRHHRRRVGAVRLEVAEAVARRPIRRDAIETAGARSGGAVEGDIGARRGRSSPSPDRVPGPHHRDTPAPGNFIDFDDHPDVYRCGRGRAARGNRRGWRAVCVRLQPVPRAGAVADPLLRLRRGVTARSKRRGVRPRALGRANKIRRGATGSTTCRAASSPTVCRAIGSALVAEAEIDLPPGGYTLRTISDDGIRVWMDDERIVDRWTPHESAIDTVPMTGGKRRFKVEYYEIGGFAELRFEILRR